MTPRTNATTFTSLLLLAAMLLAGCDSTRRRVPEGVWPWLPVVVDFHRMSRVVDVDGVEVLSLHLEFVDADGDPVKFSGPVTFRIIPENTLNESWTFGYDLSNLRTNADHWDHVTSMYEFDIEVGWDDPPLMHTPIRIRVSAQSPETGLLESGITVRRGD